MPPKREKNETKVTLAYIPHGVNHKIWRNIEDTDTVGKAAVEDYKRKLFGSDVVKFVVLYNSRNIRRKMTSDVILAYQKFLKSVPTADREFCRLLLHTQPVDENGTDLPAVLQACAPEIKAVFSNERLSPDQMVYLYNLADVVINLASNEGFGIGTLEAMMSERMIIANVTGGLQDQMGFVDENGQYLDPSKHFGPDWGTNADKKYLKCGEWVIPVFPNNRSLIGSPATPYIFDDRCDWNEAADAIKLVYDMGDEERARRGKLGREFALKKEVGMSTELMCDRFISNIDDLLNTWTPKKQFDIYKGE
jgi:glycosyltransferase involved in cell wall biosynthesis